MWSPGMTVRTSPVFGSLTLNVLWKAASAKAVMLKAPFLIPKPCG
jgi:hypothetical protein